MIGFEQFIRAIFGLYPYVSRREYVNLVCDNAALTSAVEQKERARMVAVEEIQRLRRALNDAQERLEAVYRVCYVEGQGFGYMDPAGWANVPSWARTRVQVLALCQSEAAAQLIVKDLPSVWQDSGTYHNLLTGETRWVKIDGYEVKR